MEKVLVPQGLIEKLAELETCIISSLTAELKRINRKVHIAELPTSPFAEDICHFMETVWLDKIDDIIVGTSLAEIPQKYLSDCFSNNEIYHFDAITFLGHLKEIP